MISAAIIILSQFILSLRADKLITVISDGEPDQFIRSHPIDRMQRLYGNENDQNFGHGNITHDMTAYSPAISAILSIILPLIAVATIGGNFLVILAVTLVKKLQTPSNILIVSLAFSDFFVGLLVLPFAILDLLKGYWPFNEPLCDMYISFDVLLCTASILNLCAISIDRYLVITRPLTYVSKRTPCRMAQMIAATWIISALICIPPNIGWKSPFQEGRCEYSEDVGYQIYATFCAFYLPLLVMLVLYGKIFKLAREMSRNEQRQMMPYTQNNLQHQTSQTAVDPNDLNSRTCLPRQVESSSEKCDNDAFVNSVTSGSNPGPVDTTGLRPLTNGKSEEDRIRRQTANTVTFSEDESHTRASFWKSPSNPDLVRRRSKNSSETKVIKTLGIIMGCFCLCWLPFFMVQTSQGFQQLRISAFRTSPHMIYRRLYLNQYRQSNLSLEAINPLCDPDIKTKFYSEGTYGVPQSVFSTVRQSTGSLMPQLNWWTRRDTSSTTGLLSAELVETTAAMENALTNQEHRVKMPDMLNMLQRASAGTARRIHNRISGVPCSLPFVPVPVYQPEHARTAISVDPTAMSVISSSAPTSPNSSQDEEDHVNLRTPYPLTSTFGRRCRIPSRPTTLRTRRRPGFITTCSPFFGRLGGVHSPYQSDISQSAPSSPTMDTYETLPLVENVVTMDECSLGMQSARGQLVNLTSTVKSILSNNVTSDPRSAEAPDPALLHLLQRLGIQTVWPCLRDHGVTDLHGLGRLNRDELIRMGITDAETRGTLVTAGQMLGSRWLNANSNPPPPPPPLPVPPTPKRGPNTEPHQQMDGARLTEKQALHDSGCSSSNEFSGGTAGTCRNVTFDFSSANQHSNTVFRNPGDRFWPVSTTMVKDSLQTMNNMPPIEPNFSVLRQCSQPFAVPTVYSHSPARTACPFDNSPARTLVDCNRDASDQYRSQGHGQPNSGYSGRNGQSSTVAGGQSDGNTPNKTPVGILRNAREGHDSTRQPHLEKRASSTAPKCVKIDERSLLTSRQISDPASLQDHSQSMLGRRLTIDASNGCHFLHQNSPFLFTGRTACPLTQQEQTLRMCLQSEGIDLTQNPYSNEMGQANIPLRLTQRYAFELGWDLSMVAILMEAEREHRLREAGRPVVSFIDDIQSQRYLNCDGIKTGSIEDFLIGIGLPMYIDRVKRMSGSLSKSSQPEQSITPVQLLKMSDTELINEIGFTKGHLDWLRRESSVIPSVLLSQLRSGSHTHHKTGPYINSLTREHKNTIQRHSSRHAQRHQHLPQQRHNQQQRQGSQSREMRKDHF